MHRVSLARATRRAAAALTLALALPLHAQAPAASTVATAPEPSRWFDWSAATSWWPWRTDTTMPPWVGVTSPHYGDSLFYFFQGRYFTSVTRLMTAQSFERMAPHDDEAEILRGGLFLSYGMHREAGEVFARLIDRGAKPPVRDRAWFYLAKIRYQRGLYAEAEQALGRIDKPLPGDLQEDRVLLAANVLMALGKPEQAVAVLEGVKPSAASSYVRYNLGVALVRNGDVARGAPLLDAVGRMPASTDEFRSLRDRANVALGFAALQDGRPQQARGYLERVRLAGIYSNKALLGFGWASAAQGQMKSALVPWTELATRAPADAAVLEAKLAVPYALTDLGASSQALALYQQAITAFDRENVEIDAAVASIRSGRLLDALIAANPGDEMGWFWSIRTLPDAGELAMSPHLAQLMATHPFQEGFKNYRDLRFLEGNLTAWRQSLTVLRDMLANRRQAYAERLPQVRNREQALDVAGFGAQVEALSAELDRVERERDAAAFADARERELAARLARVRETLAAVGDDPAFDAARERTRLAAGALLWQQEREFSARLWNAKKALREVQANAAEVRVRDAALAAAERDEPARLDAFDKRIDALAARVDAMLPTVTALAQEQQAAVQEMAVADLLRQKERLAEYGTQARFAVAQIVDRASLAPESIRAPAR
jgi:TolA-binding protein